MQDSLIGRQLANFRIERVIGRGGMACVYYGVDVKLNRPVAIKMIDARYRDDPAYAERFIREAQAVAGLRHENVIQVYYADDQDGLYYFVMDYVDGLDLGGLLSQYAAEGELMPHADVLRIGRAVADALDCAHKQGIIHRDLKPSNVMVAGDGRIVLTDFGLALNMYEGSMGQVFGSSRYIAPEQARSSAEAVPQSDLYSLGVILYEMLTGAVPFDDPSPTTAALQHLTQSPPLPRSLNPALGQAVEAVLLTSLSKSPQERYQTGCDLMDALEEALQAEQPVVVQGARPLSRASVSDKVASHVQASHEPPPAQPSPTADDSLLGRQLDEYRLEALLGHGGMARVYRGLDTNLERHVAIKVIDTPFQSDSDHIARFKREAQAIAQLEHPNIVRLYRYGEADGLLYMAMQYIKGADLGSVLARHRSGETSMSPEEASRIVREVCQALDYAHKRGVIHRDIKPSNIMLDEEGHIILTDFGLALMAELGTRGEIFGSPYYMSPEQAMSSANVVPQSDLYSVGAILYEMFTEQPPFDAEDPLEVAMQHMSASPRPPRELRPEISPELEAVILKALAKEPGERYQSGAELAQALDQALQIAVAPQPEKLEPAEVSSSPSAAAVVAPPELPPQAPEASSADVLLLAPAAPPHVEPVTPETQAQPVGDVQLSAASTAAPQQAEPAAQELEAQPALEALPPIPAAVVAALQQGGQVGKPDEEASPLHGSVSALASQVRSEVESVLLSTVLARFSEEKRMLVLAGVGIGIVITLLIVILIVFLTRGGAPPGPIG